MKFTLEIDLDNSSMNNAGQISDALRETAEKFEFDAIAADVTGAVQIGQTGPVLNPVTQEPAGKWEIVEPDVVAPAWMTAKQIHAIHNLYLRDTFGAENQQAFFSRVQDYGDYCGLSWCGMFIGIEKDGYAHS